MLYVSTGRLLLSYLSSRTKMSDKSDLKAELERKKQRLAQIREEKKRKEEEKKKKEVRRNLYSFECDVNFFGLVQHLK